MTQISRPTPWREGVAAIPPGGSATFFRQRMTLLNAGALTGAARPTCRPGAFPNP